MGADYNGVDLLPEGLGDVSTYPTMFAALMEDGWTDEELALLANGNIMRAFRQMEQARDDLADERWAEDRLDSTSWYKEETNCMSEVEGTKMANEEDDSGAGAKSVSFVALVGLIATHLAMK